MEIILVGIPVLFLIAICFISLCTPKYNSRGFNRQGIHRNGTRYDDFGYDVRGYDRNGFDQQGYDSNGYDSQGYCRAGYNREGKNRKGQYNRLFDAYYGEDGFYNPKGFPIIVTPHAQQRMAERIPMQTPNDINALAREAYCYGKSKRQVRGSAAALMEEIEARHGSGIVLIYRGYIYIFSKENVLITVYKNEHISL